MKKKYILIISCLLFFSCSVKPKKNKKVKANTSYLQNRAPLKPRPYLELPLGDIKPQGWLKEQLKRMATGLTGSLDSIYPAVLGKRNGWLGGDGDGWERGPYWLDGLVPLAYILDDASLKAKIKPWIKWTLNNQAESGYLGPVPFKSPPKNEPGLQRGMRKDWWPKMVMLKVLQQYYSATQDKRVLEALTRYFKFQLKELPKHPLDELTFWGNRRGADNLATVYWLYNITGDDFLLDLGDLIHKQTFPWASVFENKPANVPTAKPYSYFSIEGYPFDTTQIKNIGVSQIGSIHTVNFAQGLKTPLIYYQKTKEPKAILSVKKALQIIKEYHGQPQGMYGGDEPLHGSNPVQGIEFCAIAENMFSLETMLQITGDTDFADLLEKITYNALPTQASDDYNSRQYFQAANQVQLTEKLKTSYESKNHAGTDFVFGVLTGYPCCTTNMHQSWPKFVQNLFYATPDGGVAALLYAPSSAQVTVAGNTLLKIKETTEFPFRETITFKLDLSTKASFPFHLRIPKWTKNPSLTINGRTESLKIRAGIAIINRKWKSGDRISLKLPMKVKTSSWYKGATAIERGPLVYALGIEGERKTKNRNDGYGEFTEIYPKGKWNFGLIRQDIQNIEDRVEVVENSWDGSYPWNMQHAPITIKIRGMQIPQWELKYSAPQFPELPKTYEYDHPKGKGFPSLKLIPYGCTTLRITEFPTYPLKKSN